MWQGTKRDIDAYHGSVQRTISASKQAIEATETFLTLDEEALASGCATALVGLSSKKYCGGAVT